MDLHIAGKWALVCASSRGLGLGCAQALAAEGVNLIMNARDAATLTAAVRSVQAHADAAAQRHGWSAPRILGVSADITTEAGRAAVLSATSEPIDILINNAGGPPPGDFRRFGQDDWLRAVQANMLTPIALIQATIEGMAARGFGRIINITSSAVKAPVDILALSNGARSGLTGFVAGLARSPEFARRGVTINNILPGKFDTDRLATTHHASAAATGQSVQAVRQAQAQQIPTGRFGTAAEFGALCAFLCSTHAAYITGQNLLPDGGLFPGTF